MNKLEQAMEDHKQGKWEEADKAYKEMLLEEPNNMDIMYILATSQMSQNKLDEALTTINKAIEVEDVSPAFHQVKGSILTRMGRVDEAKQELETALEGNPNLYQSHIVLGHIDYTNGVKKEAQKHFEMAIKIDPKQPEGQVNLAKILLDEGEIETAINMLRTIEKEHPEQASVKLMMGQAFIEKGAYSFAENYFQKVLAMHPDYTLAGLYLGITKLNTGDFKNAENLIKAFNQQYPNTREGIAALGLMMFNQKQYNAAQKYLEKAIGHGLAPMTWQAALVESKAKAGDVEPAIKFYKDIERKYKNKAATFRLAELYEFKGKIKKAKKQYKKIESSDSNHISSLLGLARLYIIEENHEKAMDFCQQVLNTFVNHAEATLLYLTCLLYLEKTSEALEILEKLDYEKYNEIYRRTFRLQHGLILDQQKDFEAAMTVFKETSKDEQQKIAKNSLLTEQDLQKCKELSANIKDNIKDPVFIIGAQSTMLNKFIMWLNMSGVKVLNDRLVSLGRADILFALQDIDVMKDFNDERVEEQRKLYFFKAHNLLSETDKNTLFADSMYLNLNQLTIIKKFFPKAKIVLLTRETPDIWLNQEVFGDEPVEAKEWTESINQIISMGLNITQVNADKWLANEQQTMDELTEIFERKLEKTDVKDSPYWRKAHFELGHWKNYKAFLGA